MVGTVVSAIPERPAWLRSPSAVRPSCVSTQQAGPEEEYASFGVVTSLYHQLVKNWRVGDALYWLAMQPRKKEWQTLWRVFTHLHEEWLAHHVAVRLTAPSRDLPEGEWVFSIQELSTQIPGYPPAQVLPALVEAEQALPLARFVYLEPLWRLDEHGQRLPVNITDFQRDLDIQQTFFQRYRRRWGGWMRWCQRWQRWEYTCARKLQQVWEPTQQMLRKLSVPSSYAWHTFSSPIRRTSAHRRWNAQFSAERVDEALDQQTRFRRMGVKVPLESILFDPIIAFWLPQEGEQWVGLGTQLRLLAHWD